MKDDSHKDVRNLFSEPEQHDTILLQESLLSTPSQPNKKRMHQSQQRPSFSNSADITPADSPYGVK